MAYMTAEEALEAAKGMTFEKMWALMMEDRKRQEEWQAERTKETDRMIAELTAGSAELKTRVDATTANVDKMAARVDRVCKNVGGLNDSIGALIETLIASRLWEKFPQYNFNGSARRIELLDEHKKVLTEVDILLVNTEWTMAVEVKREPDMDDVRHHLKRMKLLRQYSYTAVRGKKLVGAIAGGAVSREVRDYAQKSGLYVLELNGEQVSLVESPSGFTALEC
jgi:predicted RecB family endonuclease